MHVFLKCWIGKNQLNKQLCEINSKDIYNILLEDISERQSSEKKWYETTDLDLSPEEWKDIYTITYKKIQTNKRHQNYRI
jgi:hypothetical protein